jgi:acetyl/propionyl-CoA carboxylase alpha subunit
LSPRKDQLSFIFLAEGRADQVCVGPLQGGIPAVRIDTGVFEGAEISMFYDPMISKLITYGKTRDEALKRMNKALDGYVIKGLSHNLCFLKELCRHPRFQKGDTSTKFIPQEFPDGFKGVKVCERGWGHPGRLVSRD